MTRKQKTIIEMLKREAKRQLFYGGEEDYEFKQFEIKDYDSFVSVSIETGRKNDEGTLAAVLCRDHLHLFIGKRGAITYWQTGRKTTQRLNGMNLMTVVLAQR